MKLRLQIVPWVWILLSFCIVAWGEPDISPFASVMASALGYAFFWKGMLGLSSKFFRFWLALFWFGGVSLFHLNWLMADQYVGSFILVFLLFWLTFLGIQFALTSLLVKGEARWLTLLVPASVMTLFEYLRLHILSGYSWNPIGLALTATTWGRQGVAIGGIFGLTFWVLATNLLFLQVLSKPFRPSRLLIWSVVALSPYFFGFLHLTFHQHQIEKKRPEELAVVLVQTSLTPEQKVNFIGEEGTPYSVYDQWRRILFLLKEHHGKPIDLIAFSESVVPYGTEVPLYSKETIKNAFLEIYGKAPMGDFAGGNGAFAQAVSSFFDTDVVIGLEDFRNQKAYNSAFLFSSDERPKERYEKRILIPLAEYIPFNWCKKYLRRYGIWDSYTPGTEAKVFTGKKGGIGVSICYEETFGHLMRENKIKKASLLVNLSNDVWYPKSRLPLVHFTHGRLRAIEEGIPVVRACNTGFTCAIDSLGRTMGALGSETPKEKSRAGALYCALPLYTYRTLYTFFGDYLIVSLVSLLSLFSLVSSYSKITLKILHLGQRESSRD